MHLVNSVIALILAMFGTFMCDLFWNICKQLGIFNWLWHYSEAVCIL